MLGMKSKLAEVIHTSFKLHFDFVTPFEETQLLSELSQRLKRFNWNDGHFDGKIVNYREFMISDTSQFPKLSSIVLPSVKKYFRNKALLPIHVLELRMDGKINPHIDNKEYSGSIIAGLSLLRESNLVLSNSFETEKIKLPRRSLYIQK